MNDDLHFTIQFDDEPAQSIHTPSLVIANAAPLTTALAQGGEPPDLTDGKLDVTWLAPQSSADRQFLSLAELVFSTTESKLTSETIQHTQARSIRVSFDQEISYAVDGEIYQGSEVHVETKPKNLKVLSRKD